MPLRILASLASRSAVLLLSSALILGFGAPGAKAAALCTSTPFTSTLARNYRIPSVVAGEKGRLYAFAEARINNWDRDDYGEFDIDMVTSTDNGCTWSTPTKVIDYGTNRAHNPVAVYYPALKQVLLFATLSDAESATNSGIYLQRITGDGSSVNPKKPTQIKLQNGSTGITSTGHAIVLTQGKKAGRIVVATGHRQAAKGIYSDDSETWYLGFSGSGNDGLLAIEGTVAELLDGSLLVSYRDNGRGLATPGKNRVSAVSTDQGKSIGAFTTMSGIVTVPVQGSLLQTTAASGGLLLLSAPATVNPDKLSSRRGMRIFISNDQGQTWLRGLDVTATSESVGYSDLVQLNATTVGLLHEHLYKTFSDVVKEGTTQAYWTKITFRQVAISDLAKSAGLTISPSAPATAVKAFALTHKPRVNGTAKVGKKVTSTKGVWSPAPTTHKYQWLRNGATIKGATSSTYTLTKADRNKKISVRVTVTRSGYTSKSSVSASRKVT